MTVWKTFTWMIMLVGLTLAMAACGASEITDMTLDLETLEAEVPGGVLQAEAVPGAFVGAVNDDVYIAIIPQGTDGGDGAQEVAAYLCNGDDVVVWLTGELQEGQGTLTDGDTRVEIESMAGDVSGTATVTGGEPEAFTAVAAEGDAAFYQASEVVDGTGYRGRWIVLPDGRQRGYFQAMEEEEEPLQQP